MSIQSDYVTGLLALHASVRAEFESLPLSEASLESLSSWVAWFLKCNAVRMQKGEPRRFLQLVQKTRDLISRSLSRSNFKAENTLTDRTARDVGSLFLKAIVDTGENSPNAWCAARQMRLDPQLASALNAESIAEGQGSELSPLAAYGLGRAAMKQALASPEGTSGLTLPYCLIERIDKDGIASAGADDEFSRSNVPENVSAISEIREEIARIAANPATQVRSIDRDYLKPALEAWNEANGLEQSVSPRFQSLTIHLPIDRIILLLVPSAPGLAAEMLDSLNHPTLQAEVLAHHVRANTQAILLLLAHCLPAFDDGGVWTRRTGARMLIDSFERRCLDYADEQKRGQLEEQNDESFIKKQLEDRVKELDNVLHRRPDGTRLALEWTAHLIHKLINREILASPPQPRRDSRREDERALLDAVVDCFGAKPWALPIQVWKTFGGTSSVTDLSHATPADVKLPRWIDLVGRQDCVTPVAVAAILSMAKERFNDTQFGALAWIRAVFNSLDGEPLLPWLGQNPSATLINVLAWPVARSSDASALISEIWQDATITRLRARFYRASEGISATASCAAIAELGLATLKWVSIRDESRSVAEPLSVQLLSLVDEVRFCLPKMGLRNWSATVEGLAIGFAINGLLASVDECRMFLERFAGDDDALVSASVSAAANGVPPYMLAAGLLGIGVNPEDLRSRWVAWHENRGAGIRAASSQAADYLARIADASRDKQ